MARESSCEITDDSIAYGSNMPRSPIMNTSYGFPFFWTLIAEVVLDSISVLARNCYRLARNLALPCEKVGVESWSQARISTPGCDTANFYSHIHSAVPAKADDAYEYSHGICKWALVEVRRRVYPSSGTLPVGELVPGNKHSTHSLGCTSKG